MSAASASIATIEALGKAVLTEADVRREAQR
jgi:hypothetical protein